MKANSLGFRFKLKIDSSSEILQDFSSRLGLLKNSTLWTEQLLGSPLDSNVSIALNTFVSKSNILFINNFKIIMMLYNFSPFISSL